MKVTPTIEDFELVKFCPEFEDIQTLEDYQKYFLAYIPEYLYQPDDYLVKKVAVQDDGYEWPVEGLKYSLLLVENEPINKK